MTGYYVNSGETSSGLIITSNTLVVNNGGVSQAAEIFNSGVETVLGTEISGIVHSGGSVSAVSGGVVVGETVVSGGTIVAFSGSQISAALLSGGGVSLFGAASVSAFIYQSGALNIQAGGTATGTTVSTGGFNNVDSGGIAIGTIVASKGKEDVLSGGITSGASVLSNGYEQVFGTAVGNTISGFGLEEIFSGGVASGTTLSASALEFVDINGATVNELILTGGHEYLASGATATGTTITSGGILTVSSGGIATQTVLQQFGKIDLVGLVYGTGGSASVDPNGVLTVTEAGSSYTQQLAGTYVSPAFNLAMDSQGGTIVTLTSMPCFCAGTLILTDRGEVSVEDLEVGDLVVTAAGAAEPIRWIGRRSYAGRFMAANPTVTPVVFRANSLGDGLPRRDLRVSPLHAMLIDGVLVPAGLLVNGSTILRDSGCQQVDYFHVELDHHDALLAEGAPSESFVDDDSRGMFHNASTWEGADPDGARNPPIYCAPRVESGFQLEAIRRRLAERASEIAQAA